MRIRNLILILCLLIVGCGGDVETPEQQIRSMLASAEQAVESRSVTDVVPFIAKSYTDGAGRDRRQLTKLLTGYFLRHQSIHLLIQIERIELTAETRARVELYAAMAGQPIENKGQLIAYRADLHYFELELEKQQDEWLVRSGKWRRAGEDDFR